MSKFIENKLNEKNNNVYKDLLALIPEEPEDAKEFLNNMYEEFMDMIKQEKQKFNEADLIEYLKEGIAFLNKINNDFEEKLNKMNLGDRNIAIIEHVYKQLLEAIDKSQEIILIDRSINDRQIWNYRRYKNGDMPKEQYQKAKEKYSFISKDLIDFLVITYADPLISLKRDYNSSLALEKRSFLNIDNLNEYNNALKDLDDLFKKSVDSSILIDTTYKNINDTSIEIASKIMIDMRNKYIENFKQKYNLK